MFRKHLLFTATLVVILSTSAIGQVQLQKPQTTAPAVTAAIAGGDTLRVTSPGEVTRIQLEVFGVNGEVLFDSGVRGGNIIDWKAADSFGTIGQGSVLVVVTTKDLHNQSSQRGGSLSLEAGQLTLGREAQPNALQKATLKARRQLQKLDGEQELEPLTIVTEGKSRAVVLTTHNGTEGQVTSTNGPLTLSTGDTLTGQDKAHVRVMPDGRVGIGVQTPEAVLDVNGEIRARGGIRFDDGTLLKTAPASAVNTTNTVAGNTNPPANIAGTGTANHLSKWLDSAGTLGDSAISESNGNLVVNGGNIQMTATPSAQFDSNVLFMDSNNKTAGFIASSTPAFLAANGPYMAMRGNTFGISPNQRGLISFSAGNVESPVGNEGSVLFLTGADQLRMSIKPNGNVGIGTANPSQKFEVAGNLKISGGGSALIFPDGTSMTTAGGAVPMTGTQIIGAINAPATTGVISDARLSPNVARLSAQNYFSGQNTFNGLSMNNTNIVNLANPVNATDAVNKAYADANFVKFVPGAEQLSVGDANGTGLMVNLRGGSTCCSGPGGHTPAFFKIFQNGSFVATGNLGIGVSPMEGRGYRTSWNAERGAFRSGYADNEWDHANTGYFSWAGGSNSTASGLYSLAFGDTNYARSTSSIVFGSGNEVKGAAGFSAGAGNRVCDTYGVALGNNARSGGPYINNQCDPDTFNIRGLAAVAIGYNVTADQDHTTAMGKFASNNGFQGTFIWSDGSAQASADTFRNTANNEFALRATGGFRFRTNLGGTTGCNLPMGSGVFNCTSSRTTKENFSLVNGNDVLSRLRKVPISTWNYISEGRDVRHMGPMAEDFFQAFKLGTGNTSIGLQDLAGVSLSAVQELDHRTTELQQKTAEVDQLRQQVDELRAANAALEKRLSALEQLVSKPRSN